MARMDLVIKHVGIGRRLPPRNASQRHFHFPAAASGGSLRQFRDRERETDLNVEDRRRPLQAVVATVGDGSEDQRLTVVTRAAGPMWHLGPPIRNVSWCQPTSAGNRGLPLGSLRIRRPSTSIARKSGGTGPRSSRETRGAERNGRSRITAAPLPG